MGFLKQGKWHGRAPWFFRKTGDPEHPLVFNPNYDKQTIREITDQESECVRRQYLLPPAVSGCAELGKRPDSYLRGKTGIKHGVKLERGLGVKFCSGKS